MPVQQPKEEKDYSREDWLTIKQACKALGVGTMTLWRYRQRGYIKSYYPFGEAATQGHRPTMVRFSRSEINEFMKSSKNYVQG